MFIKNECDKISQHLLSSYVRRCAKSVLNALSYWIFQFTNEAKTVIASIISLGN